MEITFLWSWLSFWIGVASVFAAIFVFMLIVAISTAAKRSKNKGIPDSLDDIFWDKTK